ncbi:MAG TPA: hypothetical protein VGU27_01285 [Candidatus Eisenbacteria bacterium]|nr:hypothetical protein [Candidatus Eisenbacteria bacterium]
MTLVRPEPQAAEPLAARVRGEAVVYRLYDVGYEIRLDQAFERLAASGPERPRPVRGEAQAIQIPNPPVTVRLGAESVTIAGQPVAAEMSARLFDFGVVSLRARVATPPDAPWREFAAFGAAVGAAPGWAEVFARTRAQLLARIAPAIVKPGESPVTEDYVVFRVHALADAAGGRLTAECLRDEEIVGLLTGESRPLAAAARRELLSQRFAYFEDDLAVLAWNAALVVEPVAQDTDVQYVLEFANAQLLELRFYDAVLDAELPNIHARTAEARRGPHLLGGGFSRLLATLQARVADATELVERVENALRVTDDVFLARIYAAALEIFRGRAWRSGIERKIAIVRDTYEMLNAESQARRAEALEFVIIVLIVLELALAVLRR